MQVPPKTVKQDWPTSKRTKLLCAGCVYAPRQEGDYCHDCYEKYVLAPGAGGVGGR